MPDYTPYQKGVIKRYYEHRDTIAVHKLAETLTNLYLEKDGKKVAKAWEKVYELMLAAGVREPRANVIVDERNLEALGAVVAELST